MGAPAGQQELRNGLKLGGEASAGTLHSRQRAVRRRQAVVLVPLLFLALWGWQGISPSHLLGHPAVPLAEQGYDGVGGAARGSSKVLTSRALLPRAAGRWGGVGAEALDSESRRFVCTSLPNRTSAGDEQDGYIGLSEIGAIDIVYLWVNGSDPAHRASLERWAAIELKGSQNSSSSARGQQLSSSLQEADAPGRGRGSSSSPAKPAPLKVQSPAASNRFNSDRDELRFSIRSVVRHMPWFRHLYIVTSGQVPSWLNVSHPRVTVVPHSSIFEHPEDLPTFNSHAIEANIHRIPGLSDNFIALNDDFFLTKPWSLADFVTEDGGEVFYEAWVAPTCRPKDRKCTKVDSAFGESLIFVDKLLLKYSRRLRYVPAHSMYFIQKAWMQQLQSEFAEEYRNTSAHRFRHGTDMQFAAAYKWYVAERQTACRNKRASRSVTDFTMVTRKSWRALHQRLHDTWKSSSPVKLVCLNDDITDETEQEGALVNKLVTGFLSKQYPQPSEFELPAGMDNSCGHLKSSYGRLPAAEDVAAACFLDQGTDWDLGVM